MRRWFIAGAFALPLAATALAAAPAPVPATPPAAPAAPGKDAAYFTKVVRPILVEKCFSCHADKVHLSNFRLDSREATLKGGKRGASITPGDPEKSLLIHALRYDGDLKMPPAGKL